ncbi:MAG: hypothetical protein WBA05_16175 [Gordonia sp. (in: high G+C Gram-positive bacteria)]|uniref:hypothetical protein n=1 Tax=Gordonia sp. (in: high G+C Gram-positive bacteria) TaxID=84139 RepID=UPI003C76C443
MIEPQGPLPPEVYWRRRLVAGLGAAVAVIAIIVLIIWMGSGTGSAPNSENAAAKSSAAAAVPPAPSTTPSAPATSEAPSGGGDHGAGGDPSPARTPEPTSASEPAPALPGVAPCSDQSLSVVLYTDKPTYTIGDQPVFTIVTTNGGLAACSRDVGKAAQNVIVRTLDGSRTLWSAQDCAPDKAVNVQALQPGQQTTDTITWSGTTSSPGCKAKRVQIAAGAYQATGKLGERESAPITFNVVAPAQAPSQQ